MDKLRELERLAKAAQSFDMDAFDRENPVIEGKEFEQLQERRPKFAKPSKKLAADAQASKMKSTTKKAYQVVPPGKAKGSESQSPRSYVAKRQKPDADTQASKMKAMVGAGEAATMHLEAVSSPFSRFRIPETPKKKEVKKKETAKSFVIPADKESVAKAGANDPGALAAYIGRKKYGSKKYAKMSASGKHHKKKTNKPGGGKRFKKLEGELSHKSFRKSPIDYIDKHYSGKSCAKCMDSLSKDNADIHSATYGERHHRGALCVSCAGKMRD
jgi:hypothetical protein